MDIHVFEKLRQQQLISDQELEAISNAGAQPVSVHWDLRMLLYLGITLLSTGLGIVVYNNIDTIGHTTIIITIALACIACYVYCMKKSKGYSNKKVESPNLWFDYVLLLGCLLLITFIGYVQFQYNFFGNKWGLATFIPMVLLFITAYYFDHIGVLSLAITNLAAWAGITVTPLNILSDNDFSSTALIFTGLLLGTALTAFSFLTVIKDVKAHFGFTYKNFGAHILFISTLAAIFHFESIYRLWFLLLLGIGFFFYKNALKENSFYFLVITLLYVYIGLSYVLLDLLFKLPGDMAAIYLAFVYLIASGIGLIRLLIYFNKLIKKNDSLQQSRPV
jgi:hypothetical protein